MPESAQRPSSAFARSLIFVLLAGIALAALTLVGGPLAAVAGALAQPAFALVIRGWRTRVVPAGATLRTDLLSLAGAWGGATVATAALVAWPLSALRQGGELGAALALSVAIGLAVIGFWRTWPLWHAIERDGGDLRAHWRALSERETGNWRGVGAAVCVAVIVALVLLPAWLPAGGIGPRAGLARHSLYCARRAGAAGLAPSGRMRLNARGELSCRPWAPARCAPRGPRRSPRCARIPARPAARLR